MKINLPEEYFVPDVTLSLSSNFLHSVNLIGKRAGRLPFFIHLFHSNGCVGFIVSINLNQNSNRVYVA